MISNILGNVKISNRNFKLIDNNIQNISTSESALETVDCNIDKMSYEEVLKCIKEFALVDDKGLQLATKYEAKKFNNIVIKAFNINPNINGYGIIANAKREELELGLKVIKKVFKNANIKFAIDGSDKDIINAVSGLGEVIKVNKELDLYNEKLANKAFGKEFDLGCVLVEDLITLIYPVSYTHLTLPTILLV